MAGKHFTILIVPDKNAEIRRYRLRTSHIKVIVLSISIFVLLSCGIAVRYIQIRGQSDTLSSLSSENRDLRLQVKGLSQKSENLHKKLARVVQLDHKVRMLTGMEDRYTEDTTMAVGGPETTDKLLYLNPRLDSNEVKELRKIHSDLNSLETQLTLQELSLQELQEFLEDRRSLLACTPSVWPLRGWVSSNFGWRRSPYSRQRQMHEGIDIAAPVGSLIRSPADGIVNFAGTESGYGRLVTIHHGYGLSTRYGHCSEILVKKGERVKRGQPVATVGVSGRATGPHLHYEVRVNKVPVDPRKYMLD